MNKKKNNKTAVGKQCGEKERARERERTKLENFIFSKRRIVV